MEQYEDKRNDTNTTLEELRKKIVAFRDERDWKKFHLPKDLALAMSIEVSEVLEHFRYKTNEEIMEYLNEAKSKRELSHEIADVLYYVILLADETNIDLTTAYNEKLKLLASKYPVEKCRGKPHKYTYYKG